MTDTTKDPSTDPNTLTVSELREAIKDKDVAVMLSEPGEDYGVVVAKGRGLAFIMSAINRQSNVVVADAAKETVRKIIGGDPEMGMTLAELKAEIPGDGISVITRNRSEPSERFISLVATGEAAQAIYSLLDVAGFLEEAPTTHSAEA